MFQRLMALLAACFSLAVPCAACTTASTSAAPGHAPPPGRGDKAITVGSFDFPESVLLAALRDLDARPTSRGQAARSVVDGWLRARALISGGRGPQ